MVEILVLETPNLGDRSYVAHDGATALVVDPQRDLDRVHAVLDRHGLRVAVVAETHLHNDYVTGGLALARETGADYLVSAADEVRFDRTPVRDGDTVRAGDLAVRVLHTPGHTPNHLSYVVEAGGAVHGVFTGGSLLFGSTGRTDLLGPEHAEALAHDQWRSARRLAAELPAETPVFPTHGFGSFCSATPTSGDSSTIGKERADNAAFTTDEDAYVADLLAGYDVYPAYYRYMSPANAAGPAAADLTPPPAAGAAELTDRIDGGEWVIDVRPRGTFAAGHAPGMLSFDREGNVPTYLGWLLPWGSPVTICGATAGDVAFVQRELARIGIDRPAAMAVGGPVDWSPRPSASYPVATFGDLAAANGVAVLDVRRPSEWAESHIAGAVHVPLHELPDRLATLPDERFWVHCGSGFRAAVAASLLDAAGRPVVHVDDDWDNAGPAGLRLE